MSDPSRRAFIAGLSAATAAAQAPTSATAPPNIVFLISDDHSAADLGCYGNAAISTPNLDRMAREGMRFERCFVTSPQCSPNRSAVLTGMMAHTTGTSRLHTPMPPWQPTFLLSLRERGYFTGAYRKVHQGADFEQKNFDYRGTARDSFETFFEKRPKDRPFFLHVGFTDPHRPYAKGAFQPRHDPARVRLPAFLPDAPAIREDLADYADEIARMDSECGQVFGLLRKHGLERNTLVVFTGDNGMPFPRAKGTCYDGGIHVPLIAWWPGRIEAGSVEKRPVWHLDLAPTWLEAAGARALEHAQGRSMLNLFLRKSGPAREWIFASRNWHNNFDPIRCIRTDRWKLIYNGTPNVPYAPISDLAASPTWAAYTELGRTGKLKAEHMRLLDPVRPAYELYDLQNDPDEFYNLATVRENRDVLGTLTQKLNDWMHDTYDFFPPPFRNGGSRPANDAA